MFDKIKSRRLDFPILSKTTYLNSAFTGLTPKPVIEKINNYYLNERVSSVGPFEYLLNDLNTAYINIATLIGSINSDGRAITDNIFVCNSCSQAINNLACALEYLSLSQHDNIVLSQLEYCSNATPWLRLQQKYGLEIRIAQYDDKIKSVPVQNFDNLIDHRTRLVGLTHVSNLIGCVLEISSVAEIAHQRGSFVLVDGAQSYSTLTIDVRKLGCDFFAFSGHKAMGPTGTGVLWSSDHASNILEPLLPKPNYTDDGLPLYSRYWGNSMSNYEGILGLGWVAEYLLQVGVENIENYIAYLISYLHKELDQFKFVRKISPKQSNNLISFFPSKNHTVNDVIKALYRRNIIGLVLGKNSFPFLPRELLEDGIIRLSLHFYNDEQDINNAIQVLAEIEKGG